MRPDPPAKSGDVVTFVGESLQVDDVRNGAADLTNLVQKRAGSATIAAGDEVRAWLYPGEATYMTALDTIVASWVIEILSGTVTFDASMGLDPAYGNPSAPHPTSLGTHTVTGPATFKMDTTLTAADLFDFAAAPMLVLVVTSGSAVVQQLKMRAWPPGGAIGAFSDVQPGFAAGTGVLPGLIYGQVPTVAYGAATVIGAEAAWDAAAASVADGLGVVDNPFGSSPLILNAGVSILAEGGGFFTATMGATGAVFLIIGSDWTTQYPISGDLTEGVDYVRAPEEVQDDLTQWAQQVGTGGTDWLGATATVTLGAATNTILFGEPTLHSAGTDAVTVSSGLVVTGAPYVDGPPVGAYILGSTYTVDVPLTTGGRYIVVSLGHTITPPAWPGWTPSTIGSSIGENLGVDLDLSAVRTRPVLPPYRYWDPNAVATPVEHILRHWPREDGRGGSPRMHGRNLMSRLATRNAKAYD